MKFALTFTTDNSWESTNTIFIEAQSWTEAKKYIREALMSEGYNEITSQSIFNSNCFYLKYCEEVDFNVEEYKTKNDQNERIKKIFNHLIESEYWWDVRLLSNMIITGEYGKMTRKEQEEFLESLED